MQQLAKLGTRLVFILCVSQAAILIGARMAYGDEPEDLLAPFAEVMPGQSVATFTPTWCTTYEEFSNSYYGSNSSENYVVRTCYTHPTDGSFPIVAIYFRNHIVTLLRFRVTGLQLGDLARQWGRPSIDRVGGIVYAHWEMSAYAITVPITDGRRFSYVLPVKSLVISHIAQSGNVDSGQ